MKTFYIRILHIMPASIIFVSPVKIEMPVLETHSPANIYTLYIILIWSVIMNIVEHPISLMELISATMNSGKETIQELIEDINVHYPILCVVIDGSSNHIKCHPVYCMLSADGTQIGILHDMLKTMRRYHMLDESALTVNGRMMSLEIYKKFCTTEKELMCYMNRKAAWNAVIKNMP